MRRTGPDEAVGRLEEALAAAQRRLVDLDEEHASIVEAARSSPPDDEHDVEGASVGYERERVRALLDHERAVVGALEQALTLARAAAPGASGPVDGSPRCSTPSTLCKRCGTEIPLERLEAVPLATLCVRCATTGAPGAPRTRDGASLPRTIPSRRRD